MAGAQDNLIHEYRNWVRLFILIDHGGRQICRDVLFKNEKLLTDGVQLYKKLQPLRSKICQFKSQRQIIFSPSGFTNHNDFDLTLFTRIIEVLFGKKYESLVEDVRNARNQESHRGNKELSDADIDKLWDRTADMLKKYNFGVSLVDGLKDGDPFSDHRFKDTIISIQGR